MNSQKHEKFPILFSKGSIESVELKNRTIVSPMTRTSAKENGIVTNQMAEYYSEFARGGWGLIIAEATYIDEKYSQGYNNQPGISNEAQMESWRKVVDLVHAEGVPIFLQIFHAGAVNQGNSWVDGSLAPSPIQPKGEQISRYNGEGFFQIPREIRIEEFDEIIESYASATKRAHEVGFDGVEVHGANGYLMDQFLTTYTNKRNDAYGGGIENRFKFHIDVMNAVRKAVPNHFPVGVRISQTKVNDREYSWPGGVQDAEFIFSSLGKIENLFIDVCAHLGCAPVFGSGKSLAGLAKEFSGSTVIANGKLDNPQEAERVLNLGEGDFVAIAKGALADPEWPHKIFQGLSPIPFQQEMITPLATIENVISWRKEN
tara:strand:+ start:2883 stop:4001 length:1119 start_codon:yes stop_codon:yes gene_type:complete